MSYSRKRRHIDYADAFCKIIQVCLYYSPGMIASLGHTSAQLPHSMQVSGSM